MSNRAFSISLFFSACISSFVPGSTIRSASLCEGVHGSISSHFPDEMKGNILHITCFVFIFIR